MRLHLRIKLRVHFPEGLASGSHNPPEAFRLSPLKREGGLFPEATEQCCLISLSESLI